MMSILCERYGAVLMDNICRIFSEYMNDIENMLDDKGFYYDYDSGGRMIVSSKALDFLDKQGISYDLIV